MIRRVFGIIVATVAAVVFAGAQVPSEKTPIFTCGEDQKLGAEIPLHWTNIVLAGDGHYVPCPVGTHDMYHREMRESNVIARGLRSADPQEQRWAARAELQNSRAPGMVISPPLPTIFVPACDAEVQQFGQAENLRRWYPGTAFRLLKNTNIDVRKEAAYALGAQLAKPNLDSELLQAALKELHVCWFTQTDPEVQGLLLEALGVVQYEDAKQADDAQVFLVKESRGLTPKILGAVRGLEALFRLNPQFGVRDDARARLRELVLSGVQSGQTAANLDRIVRIKRSALMALQAAHDTDAVTMQAAATDSDWQMRRLAAGRLNVSDAAQAELARQLAVDPAFQVRYELLGPLGRQASSTGVCAPIVSLLKDESPAVVMRAMDALAASCTDLEDVTKMLEKTADLMSQPGDPADWHLPSRALATLARIKPEAARPRLAAAAKHPVWQVRAMAADLSVAAADETVAVNLAADPEPNVQTAALNALFRLKHPAVVPAAIRALQWGTDYQLLLTAATVLQGLPADAKEDATNALLDAVRRLTAEETDTSRDPRVAILNRLAETMPPERSTDLLPFAADYDDVVRLAASKAFAALITVPPAEQLPRRRYPYQPTQAEIANLPTAATIRLEQGSVLLRLLPEVAPVTIARFAALANGGFYNNRIFHRVVPNFIVQGGGPGGNDYAGTSRFMRDEVGPQAAHVRGAVGMSSRGTDEGDGQIFIDLVDLPRLDRDYTVFAYVTKGMELVDSLLDGAKILNITVK